MPVTNDAMAMPRAACEAVRWRHDLLDRRVDVSLTVDRDTSDVHCTPLK